MRHHALFLLLALVPVALAMACTATDPTVRVVEPTTDAEGEDKPEEQTVLATTTDAAPNGATVGVAATSEQTEIPQEETSAGGSPARSSTMQSPASQRSPAPFIDAPQTRGGAGYGADSTLAVRYGIHPGYERVVVDLGTGTQPAGSVPEWNLSSPTGDGVLRVTFPSVVTTGVSDGGFSGPLLGDFHVVRAPDGGMFVDIFAESAFTYRVMELLDPARLVIDFKPSEATLDLPLPVEGANTVLVEPRRGAKVSGSLTLSGYSRNPEAVNTIILVADGKELVRETAPSNDWTNTWGYFETTLDLPPFDGRATLGVGAASARDGSFEGVKIPVYGSG
ncbi:MAG: Gmad2 immunoglobulin-like domain-containing protein [Rubrobacteraceae bacterium]